MRDLYQSSMDEILVDGEEGYTHAKSFMKSLMPSHARKVKAYKDPTVPLFYRHQVESQIDAMHNATVQLKSGGYIVINMTEALVAIDVNSGKATRERHIEETAYKTNLEAAEEIARQLRLRDLAGLLVIDFIDMEESRHNRSVERKLKEAMRLDRARIQLGRISPFGLLEMSRQRLRPSLFESSTTVCPNCNASGFVRTTESVALHILRALEEEGIQRGGGELTVSAPPRAALHLLNPMRNRIVEIEQRYGFRINVQTDDTLVPPAYVLERQGQAAPDRAEAARAETIEGETAERKRSRGRRRRKKTEEQVEAEAEAVEAPVEEAEEQAAESAEETREDSAEDKTKRRRRRGKRGGRRRSRGRAQDAAASEIEAVAAAPEPQGETAAAEADAPIEAGEAEAPVQEAAEAEPKAKPKRRRSPRKKKAEPAPAPAPAEETADAASDAPCEPEAEPEAKPKRRRRASTTKRAPRKKKAAAQAEESAAPAVEESATPAAEAPVKPPAPEPLAAAPTEAPASNRGDSGDAVGEPVPDDAPEGPPRRGWWQRFS
jgi:ribonuclease E